MQYDVMPMLPEHWPQVCQIYREGIATGDATFETEIPSLEKWDRNHLPECRLVILSGGDIFGWAALNGVSHRIVYKGVAEVSIYIKTAMRERGVGKFLLNELILCSEKNGFWTLQGAIFPENIASIKLFKFCGFREVGMREKLGQMNGIWRDVLLMERRSYSK